MTNPKYSVKALVISFHSDRGSVIASRAEDPLAIVLEEPTTLSSPKNALTKFECCSFVDGIPRIPIAFCFAHQTVVTASGYPRGASECQISGRSPVEILVFTFCVSAGVGVSSWKPLTGVMAVRGVGVSPVPPAVRASKEGPRTEEGVMIAFPAASKVSA
ncbi:unnamed protein product [Cyprideis torosa]|uniref:Uncharacterized protein n=1 Tax=Cyprideis torosa TaxID=163714 RepID=A0A7R8W4G2_9CRUS|nr:unnamed protein product [Cyprideis torosa]CAG0884180.1 unnamed protein product [Cyprideis torosa]